MTTESIATRFAALGNPTRLEVFRLLTRAGRSGLPVGAVQKHLDIPGSTLSHHIRHLVTVGLIAQTRRGASLICTVDAEAFAEIGDFLSEETAYLDARIVAIQPEKQSA